MADPQLFTDPPLASYTAAQEGAFVAAMTEQDRHTVVVPLDQPEQLLLTPDCRTQKGGFRLGGTAFRQLCRAACPGLSNVVADVAGLRRQRDEADRARFSLADALMVLNTVVRRRFRTDLDGMQAVRDTRTGVIDGLVGRTYRRLPNLELYQRCAEVLRTYRVPVAFHGANLYGRYVVLHYQAPAPLFAVAGPGGPDAHHAGLYYSNSETGDGSVRAAATLVRAASATKALGHFGRAGRLIHAGKDFARRFEQLLNRAAESRPEPARLRAGAEALLARPLGFGGTEDADEKRFVDLAQTLQVKGLSAGLAKRAVRAALVQGSFDRATADARYARPAWAGRTAYDLYNALTRVACGLPITVRERVEQMAYALLTGRLTLRDTR